MARAPAGASSPPRCDRAGGCGLRHRCPHDQTPRSEAGPDPQSPSGRGRPSLGTATRSRSDTTCGGCPARHGHDPSETRAKLLWRAFGAGHTVRRWAGWGGRRAGWWGRAGHGGESLPMTEDPEPLRLGGTHHHPGWNVSTGSGTIPDFCRGCLVQPAQDSGA